MDARPKERKTEANILEEGLNFAASVCGNSSSTRNQPPIRYIESTEIGGIDERRDMQRPKMRMVFALRRETFFGGA